MNVIFAGGLTARLTTDICIASDDDGITGAMLFNLMSICHPKQKRFFIPSRMHSQTASMVTVRDAQREVEHLLKNSELKRLFFMCLPLTHVITKSPSSFRNEHRFLGNQQTFTVEPAYNFLEEVTKRRPDVLLVGYFKTTSVDSVDAAIERSLERKEFFRYDYLVVRTETSCFFIDDNNVYNGPHFDMAYSLNALLERCL